ncbi:hypothetical protein Rsub_08999 [Raphidocelis subcapitata]|uniref:Uncharacterized protein n=1 Tax=Raphidocelis subcapitata TaxID=307507 RepID=A0A2V0PBL0_9CHLO|nr:hypothetical protein Rsub_08999 [Raphidocelis subcapitata]|eukprot:GBF96919.1 hypothetical protein Rsub_08999 [Raphidocelis subcapitata]
MAHISAALASNSQLWGDRGVWHCDGRRALSGRALHAAAARLSAALSARLGCRPGDRVALLGLNTPEYLVALLAATDAGALACPLNWRWSDAELAAALALVAPAVVCVDAACEALLAAAARRPGCPPFPVVRLAPVGGALGDAAAGRQPAAGRPTHDMAPLLQPAGAAAQAELQLLRPPCGGALIVFTSGTTSTPKGAVLAHTALLHQSMAKLAVVGYSARDSYLHAAPLCHIGGLSSALAALLAGAQHVFMPRYSPADTARLVRRHRVTALIAVPAMVEDLLALGAEGEGAGDGSAPAPGASAGSLPSVLRVLVGGGGMRPAVAGLVVRLFPNAVVSTAYGMTEAASSITFLCPAARTAAEPGGSSNSAPSGVCVGAPAPGVQVAIAAPTADGPNGLCGERPLPLSASSPGPSPVGEVLTRGPHVMAGYWQDPEQTQKALLPDGWLRTGDLGALDAAGRLWLVGRAKDTVRSGGENVHAAEVEAALEQHPAIAAAAVVGLPHSRLGEMVAAAVVLRPGWAWREELGGSTATNAAAGGRRLVTPAELQQHCRAAGLTAFKLPRRVAVLAELPRNSSGKVVKPAVKQALLTRSAL